MLGTSVLLALKEIKRHKMRSFLTTLGIIIGVASVVTMVSLGNGASASIQQQIMELGSNLLTIVPGKDFGRGGGNRPKNFSLQDIEMIRSQIAGIDSAVPRTTTQITAVYEAQNWSTSVSGTTNEYMLAANLKLASGQLFTESEQSSGKSVCILGDTVNKNLFSNTDAIGKNLRLGIITCRIIGVLSRKGQSGLGQDTDDQVIMPIKSVMRRFTGNQDIQSILVTVNPKFESKLIIEAISDLLRERRRIPHGMEDDFSIFDSQQLAETLSNTTKTLTLFLGAVAAVSLIVGGIGIMNIMLVSVTERTREIGIRLAIGAVPREILMQFLIEAITLSALGGIIGLLIAFTAIMAVAIGSGLSVQFDIRIATLSFFFSSMIGVVFGYFPAKKAAAMNPIEALRHE